MPRPAAAVTSRPMTATATPTVAAAAAAAVGAASLCGITAFWPVSGMA